MKAEGSSSHWAPELTSLVNFFSSGVHSGTVSKKKPSGQNLVTDKEPEAQMGKDTSQRHNDDTKPGLGAKALCSTSPSFLAQAPGLTSVPRTTAGWDWVG